MSMICLRRRLRDHRTMAPAITMTPSPTPATKPTDSKPLSPPDFHSNAAPSEAANVLIPVTIFMRGCFLCFNAVHHIATAAGALAVRCWHTYLSFAEGNGGNGGNGLCGILDAKWE